MRVTKLPEVYAMIPLIQALLAFALPLFVIWKGAKAKTVRRPQVFAAGSFACCAWGLIAELTTLKARLAAGDIGGIEDTIDGVIVLSVLFAGATVLLNLAALSMAGEKEA